MAENARTKLNAAIMRAHARGLRPFCCFGCGDWFVEDRRGKRGRPRIVCDDPECHRIRRLWCRLGRWPAAQENSKPWKVCYPRGRVAVLYEFAEAA